MKETIRGFRAIIDGEMDEYPEQAFLNVGTIDDAIEKGKKLLAEVKYPCSNPPGRGAAAPRGQYLSTTQLWFSR